MGTIVKFKATNPVEKFGFQAVRKSRKVDPEKHGQLNLFTAPSREAKVIRLKNDYSFFEQALLLDDQGDAAARNAYIRAINENDYLADAYCNLGIIESKNGDTASAIDCFTNSLKNEPRHFEAHYNLANLYLDLENLKLAKTHYQLATRIEPEYPNAYFNLALTLAMLNERIDALQALRKYKKLTNVSDHKCADALLNILQQSLETKKSV